jgi:hypothetical protein
MGTAGAAPSGVGGVKPREASKLDRSEGERSTVVTSLVRGTSAGPDRINDTGSLSFRARFVRSAQPVTIAVPARIISEYPIIFIAERPIRERAKLGVYRLEEPAG